MNLAELIFARRRPIYTPCFRILQDSSATSCLSYSDAESALLRHRRWLKEKIHSQDTVIAHVASNAVDYFLSILACGCENSAPALLNTRWTASEMAAALQSSTEEDNVTAQHTLLIYETDFETIVHQVAAVLSNNPHHRVQCIPLPTFARNRMIMPSEKRCTLAETNSPLYESSQLLYDAETVTCSDDDALIVFTSGTSSGGAKGVLLSHRAVYVQARAKLDLPCGYSASTQLLCNTVPFFHVGGLSSCLAVLLAGGTLVMPAQQQQQHNFDPATVFRSVQTSTTAANTLVVVPAMLYALQKTYNETCNSLIYPGVELILIGGQSADATTLRFMRHAFPKARVVQTYACTEAASSLTFLDVTTGPVFSKTGDCVGRPPQHVELCLFDDALPIKKPYTIGIIATRGPHVMSGYWVRGGDHPKLRQSTTCWMRTSDLGCWDTNGRLYFCGRATDSIRTGGETVMAAAVERVLQQHPNVHECAVFSLSDTQFGEVVCCALVAQPQLDVDNVRLWCEQQGLAGYKRPRRVFSVKELPRNSSGKILKFRLVERFEKQQAKEIRSKL
jgi:acyl-CoA synthetase (AMP-forming)/AMP-acid ligase II